MTRTFLYVLVSWSAAACQPAIGAPPSGVPSPKSELALTYLGVAGWQIESGATVVLVDPYFSRPRLDGPVRPDPAAIAARAPSRADLILVSHAHVDHLLDAPSVALATGAQLLGSRSAARVARAHGVPRERIVPVKGGEDYAFAGFSLRVLPSLHSALDDKHTIGGEIGEPVQLPMTFAQYEEGGTFAYLLRVGGHEIFVQGTASFIERELEGLRPDVAIVATGLRDEVHDYTCRLLRALGKPRLVYTTHFDDWRAAPTDAPAGPDLQAFIDEVRRCAPGTRVVVPRHFERMVIPV